MRPDLRIDESASHGAVAVDELPPRKRIELGYRGDRSALAMPRAMFRGRVWLIFAAGLPFVVIPSLVGSHLLVDVLFKSVGLIIVAFGLFAALFRQVIVDEGEQLVVEIDLFGRPVHSEAILKRDVESVTIRAVRDRSKDRDDEAPREDDDGRHRAVYLDASAGRSYCLGPCLTEPELAWLQQTVTGWVRR